MNNKNQKVPRFRFSGLYNCWSEEELGEISIFNPPSELPDIFEYIDLESVQGTTILNHRTENKKTAPSRAQRLAQWGDIFYQTVRPYQKNNCLYELPYDNYVFSTGYAQIRTNLDKYFLFTYIQNEVFVSKVLERSTGTSYPSINTKDLSKIKIFFPGSFEEQTKIGVFFKQLDNIITLQQQLLNDHKQLKKAMLQKMFPQKGESVPRIRFAGFNDEWVIKILGDVVEIRRGLTYKPDDVTFDGIRVLRSSNIKEDIFELREDDVFVRESAINIKNVENGDILITAANGSTRLVGKHAIINKLLSNTVHGGFMLTITSEYNTFINAWMSSSEYKRTLEFVQGGNGSIGNLSSKTLENAKISIPSIEERQLIGKYFTKLESLISFHNEKLETYQELKKAMLQKMFI